MNSLSSGISSELHLSPVWVVGTLLVLGVPTVVAIEILSGALELQAVGLFMLFFLAMGATWQLHSWCRWSSKWFLVIATIGIIYLASFWWSSPEFLVLLVVPPVLAAVTISSLAMVVIAVGETLIVAVWLPMFLNQPVMGTTLTMLIGMWMIMGLMIGAYHQIFRFVQWSWEYTKEAQTLLEESRIDKAKLAQAYADLARANEQLTRMNKLTGDLRRVAEEARTAKERFVAHVSHELRTPLNMIIGYSEVMLQSPEIYGHLPSALLADLKVVFKNAEHLSGLIDDVLDLAEIETDQMALTKEEVSLHSIVASAILAVRPLFLSKNLYLETEIQEDLPALFCDRARMRQVLLNLLSNAGRFTQQGGVRVKAWQEEGNVVVTVTDTGLGIAAEDIDNLFKPFQQTSSSVREQYGGSGLGLSISKDLLEMHGGSIWVKSTVGIGTTFSFRLPISSPAPTAGEFARGLAPEWEYLQHPAPSRAHRAAIRPRIVVMDEGENLKRFLGRYLSEAQIVSLATLDEVIEDMAEVPSTAVVVNAESVDETLQYLSSTELPAGIPVMICSILKETKQPDAPGIFASLSKPVSPNSLLATLDRLDHPVNRLLVICDQQETLNYYRRVLASLKPDCRIVAATNIQMAKTILRRKKTDAILLDVDVSWRDGVRSLKDWHEDRSLRMIPVIVTSAETSTYRHAFSNLFAVVQRGGLSTLELLLLIKQTVPLLSGDMLFADPAHSATPSA